MIFNQSIASSGGDLTDISNLFIASNPDAEFLEAYANENTVYVRADFPTNQGMQLIPPNSYYPTEEAPPVLISLVNELYQIDVSYFNAYSWTLDESGTVFDSEVIVTGSYLYA